MGLELMLCEDCRVVSQTVDMCDHCACNLQLMAENRETVERLRRALDAWKAVAQNLWTLARAHLDD